MRVILPLAATLAAAAASAAGAVTVIGATTIHITNTAVNYLQVAEVVASQFGTGIDKALTTQGGTATALTTYQPGVSDPINAIDGNTGGNYYTDHIYSSNFATSDYLDVTLAAPTTLSSLTLYGRTDCCSGRDLYTVSISNAAGTVLYSGNLDATGVTHSATVAFDAPSAVPEPASWAMLLAGFGLVGVAARRRCGATAISA